MHQSWLLDGRTRLGEPEDSQLLAPLVWGRSAKVTGLPSYRQLVLLKPNPINFRACIARGRNKKCVLAGFESCYRGFDILPGPAFGHG